MPLTYEDFFVWVEAEPSGSGVCVRCRCREGEGRASFQVPAEPAGLTSSVVPAEASAVPHRDLTNAGRARPRLARHFGESLFNALFAGEVGRLFERSRGGMRDPKRGLRLRIHTDPGLSSNILDLPWELLSCPDTRDQFGLYRLLPVVRFLEVPRAAELIPIEPPIRVLLAAASPPSAPYLDLSEEIRLAQDALQQAGAVVQVLQHATLNALRETLRRESFHVFHFMGHGSFNAATGTGFLLFEASADDEGRVSGEILALHLQDCKLQAAVLNACESGQSGAGGANREAFGGVAAALVQGGLPAVVAMREPILDQAAITFSRTLYRELAAGEPIEAAVSEARLAIYRTDLSSPAWAIPALYQRMSQNRQPQPTPQAAAPITAEPDGLIHLDKTSEIETGSLDLVNQWGSDTSGSGAKHIHNEGRIKVSGHMIIANRKSGSPPEN